MLVNIETFLFDNLVATEAMNLIKHLENNEADDEAEHEDSSCTQSLYAKACLNTVNLRIAEDTYGNGTQDTAYSVNRHCTYGIVNLQNLINEAY